MALPLQLALVAGLAFEAAPLRGSSAFTWEALPLPSQREPAAQPGPKQAPATLAQPRLHRRSAGRPSRSERWTAVVATGLLAPPLGAALHAAAPARLRFLSARADATPKRGPPLAHP